MDLGVIISLLLIAIGLAADCFAVAVSIGASGRDVSKTEAFKVALAFGVFQGGMPVLGWLAGQTVVGLIAEYDHWVAFSLLAVVGGKMIYEFFKGGDEAGNVDLSKTNIVLMLALATSIDALAVGLGFAFLEYNITMACVIIGVISFIITVVGFWLGNRVSQLIGRWAQLVGGIILIVIGLRILVTHMIE